MSLSLVDAIRDNRKRLDETDFPPKEDCNVLFVTNTRDIYDAQDQRGLSQKQRLDRVKPARKWFFQRLNHPNPGVRNYYFDQFAATFRFETIGPLRYHHNPAALASPCNSRFQSTVIVEKFFSYLITIAGTPTLQEFLKYLPSILRTFYLKVLPDKKFHFVIQPSNIYNHDDLDATPLVLQYDKGTKEAHHKTKEKYPKAIIPNVGKLSTRLK